MGLSNTNTINNSITWASLLTGNRPLTLHSTNDPALTCANMIVQSFLAPPFRWAWNRDSVQFQTVDVQAWQENFTYPVGYRLIDFNGNMQTVTIGGTSNNTGPPNWSTVPGGTTVDNTITWTESPVSDYVQSITNFGFIELATLLDADGTPSTVFPQIGGKYWDIPNKTENLTSMNEVGRWQSIAPVFDDNNGNITFRPSPGLPDQLYTCTIVYQQRATLLTDPSQNWPIPDMFSEAYNTGFLGLIWLFADDPRAPFMLQKFAAQVIALSDGLTEQEKNSFMDQWDMFSASRRASAKGTQGIGARSAT